MTSHLRTWSLAVLRGAAVALVPVARADDQDTVPERRGFGMQLLTWDPLTGLLHGSINGRAGVGTVTMQIQDITRPQRARVSKFVPGNPVLPIAEGWNTTIRNWPGDPIRWDDVASSPFPDLPGQAVATTVGYVKLKLNLDLVTVRNIKLYPPPTP